MARLDRAIQYAAPLSVSFRILWNARSPAFAGDHGYGVGSASRLALQPRHCDAVAGKLVGALVLVMAGMALDPVPANLVRLQGFVEPLPQLGVLHRLLVGGAPAISLPAVNPTGDALPHILAVGVEIDLARLFQRFQ